MRPSLKKSVADSPAREFERYPKGSIVLCTACALPIFKLDAGLSLGMKGGRAAELFKPLSLSDLRELAERPDVDAGVRGTIAGWTLDQARTHLAQLREMRSGDVMLCPCCGDCFVQVLSVEKTETIDRGYVVELLTIPPKGVARPAPVRGRRDLWIHPTEGHA